MLIKEYRIVLPMSVDEYHVAQLYTTAQLSKEETGGGEGVEVVEQENFKDKPFLSGKYSSGVYCKKIYHLKSKVPGWVGMLVPSGCLQLAEESWNAYPYCRTLVTNPAVLDPDYARIEIESLHIEQDRGTSENALQLSEEELDQREVVTIDIANDPVLDVDYKKTRDPKIFRSQKTGRGPLREDWIGTSPEPVMCCYKLVRIQFKWWGLQTRMESFAHREERRLFTVFSRDVFCRIDDWKGLTLGDIAVIEADAKVELDESRRKGEVRGSKMV